MDHFAGLDVSVKETSICIVDDTGRIVKEVKVASEPAVLDEGLLTNIAGAAGTSAAAPAVRKEPDQSGQAPQS
jgi:hypothetical protein